MWSFVRGFEDVDVPANPIGHAEIELFTDGRGNIVSNGAALEVVNVKLPVLGILRRCEKTADGWHGYMGKTRYETAEGYRSDYKPGHVIALNKLGRPYGVVVLKWKNRRRRNNHV